MSYSRWGTSYWYTYWCVQNEETENRDTSLFTICGSATFSAKQLREEREYCMSMIKIIDPKATNAELKELETYMDRFLKNVDSSYPKE